MGQKAKYSLRAHVFRFAQKAEIAVGLSPSLTTQDEQGSVG